MAGDTSNPTVAKGVDKSCPLYTRICLSETLEFNKQNLFNEHNTLLSCRSNFMIIPLKKTLNFSLFIGRN